MQKPMEWVVTYQLNFVGDIQEHIVVFINIGMPSEATIKEEIGLQFPEQRLYLNTYRYVGMYKREIQQKYNEDYE